MEIINKIRSENSPFIGWLLPNKDKAILIDNRFYTRNHIELCNELGIDNCDLDLDNYEKVLIGDKKWVRLAGTYPVICSVEMDTRDSKSVSSFRRFLSKVDFIKLIITDYRDMDVVWKGFADKFKLKGFQAVQDEIEYNLLSLLLLVEDIDVRQLIRSL